MQTRKCTVLFVGYDGWKVPKIHPLSLRSQATVYIEIKQKYRKLSAQSVLQEGYAVA